MQWRRIEDEFQLEFYGSLIGKGEYGYQRIKECINSLVGNIHEKPRVDDRKDLLWQNKLRNLVDHGSDIMNRKRKENFRSHRL